MIKFQLIILGFFSGLLCIYGQNIGINNTDPQSALDINGDLRLRTKTITLPIGVSHDFCFSDKLVVSYTLPKIMNGHVREKLQKFRK